MSAALLLDELDSRIAAMRSELEKAKPSFAKGGTELPEEKVVAILRSMTSRTWKKDRDKALQLLERRN